MILKSLSGLFKCPVAGIIPLFLPGIVGSPVHELGQEELAHMLECVGLGEEITTRSGSCDGIKRQGFFDSPRYPPSSYE